jgi:hypothetical protein
MYRGAGSVAQWILQRVIYVHINSVLYTAAHAEDINVAVIDNRFINDAISISNEYREYNGICGRFPMDRVVPIYGECDSGCIAPQSLF